MAEQDISIHDLPNGVLTEDSLFAMAYPLNGGYASGKIAASALGKGLGEDVEFNSLQTGNKTMFGAIKELATVSYGKVLTATLTAGQTTVTFTDSDIKEDSLIDVYSDPVLNIVSDQSSAGSYAVTFEAQSSDVAVAIVIKGYQSGGGGGGIEYLYEDADLIANYYIRDSDGAAVSYSGWSCTDFLSVTGGETLAYAVKDTNNYNAWYDSTKTFIQKFKLTDNGYGHVTVPNNAAYMRMSNETGDMQKSRVWREE